MRYAFFTGATGGLGTLCVKALSETGRWTVFAAGTNETALAELSQLPNVIAIKTDITRQESVDAARAAVLGTTNRLDAIVNFAGRTAFTSMIEGDAVNDIETLLRVNVLGMARVNRTLFDLVLAGNGRIVNCSSEAGWMTAQPFAGPYVLSKYAVEAYNDSLRRELLYLGIPVIKIQPGSFETQLTEQIRQAFDKAAETTKYYQKLLLTMKPMMDAELSQKNDPKRLTRVVLRAMEAKHPRRQYRVGTGKLLLLLELLPEGAVDAMYRLLFGRRKSEAEESVQKRETHA